MKVNMQTVNNNAWGSLGVHALIKTQITLGGGGVNLQIRNLLYEISASNDETFADEFLQLFGIRSQFYWAPFVSRVFLCFFVQYQPKVDRIANSRTSSDVFVKKELWGSDESLWRKSQNFFCVSQMLVRKF